MKTETVDLILPTQTHGEDFLPLYTCPPYSLEIASMHQGDLNVLSVGLNRAADKVDRAASSKSCNQRLPGFSPKPDGETL